MTSRDLHERSSCFTIRLQHAAQLQRPRDLLRRLREAVGEERREVRPVRGPLGRAAASRQ